MRAFDKLISAPPGKPTQAISKSQLLAGDPALVTIQPTV
jgi:hypothetical protein